LTVKGVEQLMNPNSSSPVTLKIKKIDFKNNMIIIIAHDHNNEEIKCWSKDNNCIEVIKHSNIGSIIKITAWSYLTQHKIVNMTAIEAVTEGPSGTQALNNNNNNNKNLNSSMNMENNTNNLN